VKPVFMPTLPFAKQAKRMGIRFRQSGTPSWLMLIELLVSAEGITWG
jgi:hypothetical protein